MSYIAKSIFHVSFYCLFHAQITRELSTNNAIRGFAMQMHQPDWFGAENTIKLFIKRIIQLSQIKHLKTTLNLYKVQTCILPEIFHLITSLFSSGLRSCGRTSNYRCI